MQLKCIIIALPREITKKKLFNDPISGEKHIKQHFSVFMILLLRKMCSWDKNGKMYTRNILKYFFNKEKVPKHNRYHSKGLNQSLLKQSFTLDLNSVMVLTMSVY